MTKNGHTDEYRRFVENESRGISGGGVVRGDMRFGLGAGEGNRKTEQTVLIPRDGKEVAETPVQQEETTGPADDGVWFRSLLDGEPVCVHPVSEEEDDEGEVEDVGVPAPGESVMMRISRFRVDVAEEVPEITYGVRTGELSELLSIWRRDGEYGRVVRAVEAIPESERTPDQVMALADAYCHIGGTELHVPVVKAVMMLSSLADDMWNDLDWNILMAECFHRLEWHLSEKVHTDLALRILDRNEGGAYGAERLPDRMRLEERTEILNTEFRDPRFASPFRNRVSLAWERLVPLLPEVEGLMDRWEVEGSLLRASEMISWQLREAINGIRVGVSFDADRYAMTLSAGGRIEMLYEIAELVRRAPLDRMPGWTVRIGSGPYGDPVVRTERGTIRLSDVDVLAAPCDGGVRLTMHCGRLDEAVLSGEEWPRRSMTELTSKVLGEVQAAVFVRGIELSADRPEGSVPMTDLRRTMIDMGYAVESSAESLLYGRTCERPDLRVISPSPEVSFEMRAGTTVFPRVMREFAEGRCDIQMPLLMDGASVQTLYFSVPDGVDPSALRREIEDLVATFRGGDVGRVIGGATGLGCGCVDLIAWDNHEMGQRLFDMLDGRDVRLVTYGALTSGVEPVAMIDRTEPEPPEGGVLTREDVERVEAAMAESGPQFAERLLVRVLGDGLDGGRFTRRQVERDPEVWTLRCRIAIESLDYEAIFQACRGSGQVLPPSEGLGVWYGLRSRALMLIGRPDEARETAERGLSEDGSCPELWLQAAKLRSHFGDREGALEAVRRGLELDSGSESLRLMPRAIDVGADLADMDLCFPGTSVDWGLLSGDDPDTLGKIRLAEGIVTDPEGLGRLMGAFHQVEGSWRSGTIPFPEFRVIAGGVEVFVTLSMDLAAASKLDSGWLASFAALLEAGGLNSPSALDPGVDGRRRDGVLYLVDVLPTREVRLVYRLPNGDMFRLMTDMGLQTSGPGMPGGREWFGRFLEARKGPYRDAATLLFPMESMSLGELELPTGRVAMLRSSGRNQGVREFVQRVPPGRYPVKASINNIGRVVVTEVMMTDEVPVKCSFGVSWGQELRLIRDTPTDGVSQLFCFADASRVAAVSDLEGRGAPFFGPDALVLTEEEIWEGVAVFFLYDSKGRVCRIQIVPWMCATMWSGIPSDTWREQ